MSTVSVRVLEDQLSSYLQRAERGERIVVLRDGQPVAALVPLSQLPETSPKLRGSSFSTPPRPPTPGHECPRYAENEKPAEAGSKRR